MHTRVDIQNAACRLLIAVGIFGMLFPGTQNGIKELQSSAAYSARNDAVAGMDRQEMQEIIQEAERYNRGVYLSQQEQAFSYMGETEKDPVYESVLDFGDEEKVMAWVRVPSADIFLPVTHGTDAEKLQYEAGHMYGTSVPAGGSNTHAVIAAHTGLLTADLFTNLTKVQIGDYFYIHVAGEIHRYRTAEIHIVLPEEEDPWLQIEEGKDLVTLYTCTPYGINDHRLLVRGIRAEETVSQAAGGGRENVEENIRIQNRRIQKEAVWLYIRIAAGLLIPAFVLFIPVCNGKGKRNQQIKRKIAGSDAGKEEL